MHSLWTQEFIPLLSINVRTLTETFKKFKPTALFIGLLLLWFYQSFDAGLTHLLEDLFRSPDGTPNWVWFVAIFSVFVNLIFPLMITYWLLVQFKKSHDWADEFQQMIIEHMRSWGRILTWTFFLIIPGLYKWLALTFVPYVVLFSKKYHAGEVDALKHSARIFRKTWWKIIPVIVLFSVLIPITVSTNFDQYRQIWETPVGALLLGLTEFGFLIISLTITFFVFRNSLHEVDDELVF